MILGFIEQRFNKPENGGAKMDRTDDLLPVVSVIFAKNLPD